jgi:uncharacterized RDD family membrane protein YckC
MLDTLALVETPEGIALRLRPAGVVPRSVAWALDLMIRFAIIWVLAMVLATLGRVGEGVYLIAVFGIYWLYPVVLEATLGQTIGKRVVGLRVVLADGRPVTWLAAFVRNLLRVVDMLPLGYAVGVGCSLADPQGRRLGDLVAGTLVVHAEPTPRPAPAAEVPVVAPPVLLEPAERVALVAFAERAPQLTRERQHELAGLLRPLGAEASDAGVRRLLGISAALLGRR